MSFDLLHPSSYIIKRGSLIYRVGEYDAHSSPIVSLGDSFKTFLSGSIPDLQLNFRALHHDHFRFEINP